MDVRCDTWRECGSRDCPSRFPHRGAWGCTDGFHCTTADCRVRCVPAHITTSDGTRLYPGRVYATEDTHTCYYCDHEGIDVNRIAFMQHQFHDEAEDEGDEVYCCDDAVECDKRWQEDDSEARVTGILTDYCMEIQEVLKGFTRAKSRTISMGLALNETRRRIMKLIELPF